MAEIPLTRGKTALIDDEDAAFVGQFKWHCHWDGRNFYARKKTQLADGRWGTQLMHKMLTGFEMTDHINGDGLDNRRANLRKASNVQNCANRRKQRTDSSSIYKGIHLQRRDGRWMTRIMQSGHSRFLGTYDDEISAALAYDAAARELFGEFAALNFPGPSERGALTS